MILYMQSHNLYLNAFVALLIISVACCKLVRVTQRDTLSDIIPHYGANNSTLQIVAEAEISANLQFTLNNGWVFELLLVVDQIFNLEGGFQRAQTLKSLAKNKILAKLSSSKGSAESDLNSSIIPLDDFVVRFSFKPSKVSIQQIKPLSFKWKSLRDNVYITPKFAIPYRIKTVEALTAKEAEPADKELVVGLKSDEHKRNDQSVKVDEQKAKSGYYTRQEDMSTSHERTDDHQEGDHKNQGEHLDIGNATDHSHEVSSKERKHINAFVPLDRIHSQDHLPRKQDALNGADRKGETAPASGPIDTISQHIAKDSWIMKLVFVPSLYCDSKSSVAGLESCKPNFHVKSYSIHAEFDFKDGEFSERINHTWSLTDVGTIASNNTWNTGALKSAFQCADISLDFDARSRSQYIRFKDVRAAAILGRNDEHDDATDAVVLPDSPDDYKMCHRNMPYGVHFVLWRSTCVRVSLIVALALLIITLVYRRHLKRKRVSRSRYNNAVIAPFSLEDYEDGQMDGQTWHCGGVKKSGKKWERGIY